MALTPVLSSLVAALVEFSALVPARWNNAGVGDDCTY